MTYISKPLTVQTDFNTTFTFNATAGGTPVGSESDAQTMGDGNEYNLPETNASPGITLEVNFTGVKELVGLTALIRYQGSASHHVDVSVYNYDTTSLDHIRRLETSTENVMMTILFPNSGDYYDASGNAQVVFNHPDNGNTSHDFWIDYIALLS